MKLHRNWIINEVARAGEHTNEHTYVLTYIRTRQTLYPLHNFVVRGDKKMFVCVWRGGGRGALTPKLYAKLFFFVQFVFLMFFFLIFFLFFFNIYFF